jgi:hypothetical protein
MFFGLPLRTRITLMEVVGDALLGSRLAQSAGIRPPRRVQHVDVVGLVHRDDVGFQAVGHAARLAAAAAVALVERHVLAGGLLPVRGKGGVVVLVELARSRRS